MKYAYYLTPARDVPVKLITDGMSVITVESPDGREGEVSITFIKEDDGNAETLFALWRATVYKEIWTVWP